MGHRQDYWEPIRTRLLPAVGAVFSVIEDISGDKYYHVSEQRRNQFVGRIEMGEEQFEQVLHRNGYERNPLAWLKKRRSTGEIEEGSWRKRDGEKQTHLVLYDGDSVPHGDSGCLYLYAHYEYAWDAHPIKHLRSVNLSTEEGVNRVRRMLQDEGINYEFVQPG